MEDLGTLAAKASLLRAKLAAANPEDKPSILSRVGGHMPMDLSIAATLGGTAAHKSPDLVAGYARRYPLEAANYVARYPKDALWFANNAGNLRRYGGRTALAGMLSLPLTYWLSNRAHDADKGVARGVAGDLRGQLGAATEQVSGLQSQLSTRDQQLASLRERLASMNVSRALAGPSAPR